MCRFCHYPIYIHGKWGTRAQPCPRSPFKKWPELDSNPDNLAPDWIILPCRLAGPGPCPGRVEQGVLSCAPFCKPDRSSSKHCLASVLCRDPEFLVIPLVGELGFVIQRRGIFYCMWIPWWPELWGMVCCNEVFILPTMRKCVSIQGYAPFYDLTKMQSVFSSTESPGSLASQLSLTEGLVGSQGVICLSLTCAGQQWKWQEPAGPSWHP